MIITIDTNKKSVVIALHNSKESINREALEKAAKILTNQRGRTNDRKNA
jgi:NAD(P)H-dependent FMN reductase